MDTLEILHDTGRTFNDLKLNNIMIKQEQGNLQTTLIDYGFVDSFRDKKGDHNPAG